MLFAANLIISEHYWLIAIGYGVLIAVLVVVELILLSIWLVAPINQREESESMINTR
jgi:hypothetical protein